MKQKRLGYSRKHFLEEIELWGVLNLLRKIFFVRDFCIMENIFRKRVLYYEKCFP